MADIFPFRPTGDVSESDNLVVTTLGTPTQTRRLEVRAKVYTDLAFSYEQITAQERLDLLTYFNAKRGKWGTFWVRTYHPDFVLTEDIFTGLNYIYVEITNIGVTSSNKLLYVHIPEMNYSAKVISIENGRTDPDTGIVLSTKLVLSNTLPADLLVKESGHCVVERLYYVRFNQDTIVFKHSKMFLTTCSLKFKELPNETPSSIF